MITLATLPEATAQDVFNQVATHLLTQKKRSVQSTSSGGSQCAYRGSVGTSCAAGCLIADDEYDPEMDSVEAIGKGWYSLTAKGLVPYTQHDDLIMELQSIHDRNTYADPVTICIHWKIALKDLAKEYGLTLPPIFQQV